MRRAAKFVAVFLGMMAMFLIAVCLGVTGIMLLGKWACVVGILLFVGMSSYFAWMFSSHQSHK